jgi:hypothetical protein
MCTAAASYIGDLFRRPGLSSRALILRRDLIFTNAKRGETPLPAAVVSRGMDACFVVKDSAGQSWPTCISKRSPAGDPAAEAAQQR